MARSSSEPVGRRRFLAGLGAVGASLLVAACGGQPAATPAPPTPAEKVELKPEAAKPGGATPPTPTAAQAAPAAPTAAAAATPTSAATASKKLAGLIDFNVRGDEVTAKIFEDVKVGFRQKFPDIDVKFNIVPGDYYQKLQLQIASDTMPDGDFSADDWIIGMASRSVYQPLDDWLKADKRFRREDYYPVSLWNGTYKGKLYHLPWDGGSVVLVYNKDLFQQEGVPFPDPKKPMTWDEYIQKAKLLTRDAEGRRPGESGFDPAKMKYYGGQARTYQFWETIWANGGEVFNDSWDKFSLDTPEAVEAIQWTSDLMNKHLVAPAPQYQQASPVSFFAGNQAMAFAGVWSNSRYRQVKFDWDAAPLLTRKRHQPIGEYSGLSMFTKGKNKDITYEWIYYNGSSEGQSKLAGLGRVVPAVREAARSPAFLDGCTTKPCNDQVYLDELEDANMRSVPYFVYFIEMMDIYQPAMDPVWRGKKPVAEALKEVSAKIQTLIDTGKVT